MLHKFIDVVFPLTGLTPKQPIILRKKNCSCLGGTELKLDDVILF